MADIDIASPGANAAALKTALTNAILTGDDGSAPGVGKIRLALVAGTTAGTAQILLYAGTSTTPFVLADNVGGGF